MSEAIEGFPQYDAHSYDVLLELINRVPMVYRQIYLMNSLCFMICF